MLLHSLFCASLRAEHQAQCSSSQCVHTAYTGELLLAQVLLHAELCLPTAHFSTALHNLSAQQGEK